MCLYFLNELKMHRQPDVLYYVHSALTSCWNNFLWFNVLGTPSYKKVCLGNSFHVKPNYYLNISFTITIVQCCGSASDWRGIVNLKSGDALIPDCHQSHGRLGTLACLTSTCPRTISRCAARRMWRSCPPGQFRTHLNISCEAVKSSR